jgi:hypothetical protein
MSVSDKAGFIKANLGGTAEALVFVPFRGTKAFLLLSDVLTENSRLFFAGTVCHNERSEHYEQ